MSCFLALTLLAIAAMLVFFIACALTVKSGRGSASLGLLVVSVPLVGVLIWLGLTLAGWWRLKPWARTSLQIVAGLLVALGTLILFCAVVLALLPTLHRTTGVVFGCSAFTALCFAAGIALFLYLNQPAVALLFRPAWLGHSSARFPPCLSHSPRCLRSAWDTWSPALQRA